MMAEKQSWSFQSIIKTKDIKMWLNHWEYKFNLDRLDS
jgi:hypothetical protein